MFYCVSSTLLKVGFCLETQDNGLRWIFDKYGRATIKNFQAGKNIMGEKLFGRQKYLAGRKIKRPSRPSGYGCYTGPVGLGG